MRLLPPGQEAIPRSQFRFRNVAVTDVGCDSSVTDRALSRGAWILLCCISLLFVAAGVAEWINDPVPSGGSSVGFVLVIFTFPLVGAFIASRQPRNWIGWIMLGIGSVQGLTGILDGYIRYALVTEPGSLPWGDVLLALVAGSWVAIIVPIGTFLVLLFPDGRLPSPRWRPVAWIAVVAMLGTYLMITFFPGSFEEVGYPHVNNPLGVPVLGRLRSVMFAVLLLIPLSMVASASALVWRFRRSRGRERLQLKWLVAAAGVVATADLLGMGATLSVEARSGETPGWLSAIQSMTILSLALIPAAIGVAILRYRLYNIDRLVNRTLVYTALTALLAVAYLLVVTIVQRVVRPFAGDAEITVAISTLAVAALFRPLRSWIQAFIDRRFYRRKYDAAQTLASFASTVRGQVDLTSVSAALVDNVRDAMQPAHVSLWVRTRESPSRDVGRDLTK